LRITDTFSRLSTQAMACRRCVEGNLGGDVAHRPGRGHADELAEHVNGGIAGVTIREGPAPGGGSSHRATTAPCLRVLCVEAGEQVGPIGEHGQLAPLSCAHASHAVPKVATTTGPTNGRIRRIAKTKASVSLDPTKVKQARELVGAPTLSALIDTALDRLIVDELDRRHAAGYVRHPPDREEAAWAETPRDTSGIADDVDWARLYGVSRTD
jgi:hypothetical protein